MSVCFTSLLRILAGASQEEGRRKRGESARLLHLSRDCGTIYANCILCQLLTRSKFNPARQPPYSGIIYLMLLSDSDNLLSVRDNLLSVAIVI